MRGTSTLYFKALNRDFHVLGVDRQLFYLFVGLCLPIAVSAHLNWLMDLIALCIFMILYMAGVFITRIDKQMLAIYRRHIHYKEYYPTYPSVYAKNVLIKSSVPFYQGKRGFFNV
ncbi:MAG: VirB3 family type IV secretion system protein [Candidatus Aquirickettsiella sp.]